MINVQRSIFALPHCIHYLINTLRPRQNGCYFPDNISEGIFLKENVWIPIKISLKFVPKSPINNIPALVQIMAWRRPGDKPLSEPMLVRLPTHICVTRPQWVKAEWHKYVSVTQTIIGSNNGVWPVWHQAIIWTNAALLLTGHFRTNFNES